MRPQQLIIEFIADKEDFSFNDIKQALLQKGVPVNTIKTATRELKDKGVITSIKRGMYSNPVNKYKTLDSTPFLFIYSGTDTYIQRIR